MATTGTGNSRAEQSGVIWLLLLGGGGFLLWRYIQKQKKLRAALAARAGVATDENPEGGGGGGGGGAWTGSTPAVPLVGTGENGDTEININTGETPAMVECCKCSGGYPIGNMFPAETGCVGEWQSGNRCDCGKTTTTTTPTKGGGTTPPPPPPPPPPPAPTSPVKGGASTMGANPAGMNKFVDFDGEAEFDDRNRLDFDGEVE